MPHKVVGFLLGFILSMLATLAICIPNDFVIRGPGWVLLWGTVGIFTTRLFTQRRQTLQASSAKVSGGER